MELSELLDPELEPVLLPLVLPLMLSFCPIRIKSELRLFHFFKLDTLTPYCAPMRDKESPDLTTYTSDEPVDGLLDPLLELPEELELELLDEDPFLLTTKTFPGKISVVSRLFHFIKLLREMLCFEAIPLSVSPLFTVYVEFELVDGLVVFELLLELELDDCSLSVSMIWFG